MNKKQIIEARETIVMAWIQLICSSIIFIAGVIPSFFSWAMAWLSGAFFVNSMYMFKKYDKLKKGGK